MVCLHKDAVYSPSETKIAVVFWYIFSLLINALNKQIIIDLIYIIAICNNINNSNLNCQLYINFSVFSTGKKVYGQNQIIEKLIEC